MDTPKKLGDTDWTPEKVQEVLVNPIYTMGSKPLITDHTWLRAQAKLHQEMGPDVYFDKLFEVLDNLSGMLDGEPVVPDGSVQHAIPLTKTAEKTRCKEIGPFRYFPELMNRCKRKFGHLVN